MLSTLVLAVGSIFSGSLMGWLWCPIIGGGVILAAVQLRTALESVTVPSRFDATALIWIALAVAGAIWVAGATRPPGLIRTTDSYDVMEYHLQVYHESFITHSRSASFRTTSTAIIP